MQELLGVSTLLLVFFCYCLVRVLIYPNKSDLIEPVAPGFLCTVAFLGARSDFLELFLIKAASTSCCLLSSESWAI